MIPAKAFTYILKSTVTPSGTLDHTYIVKRYVQVLDGKAAVSTGKVFLIASGNVEAG